MLGLAAGAAVAIVAATAASGPGFEPIQAVPEPPGGPVLPADNRCAPITNGLGARGEPNGFLLAGLPTDEIPAVIADAYLFGSYTCLEDHLAHRVDGVVVTLLEGSGQLAGILILLPASDSNADQWRGYLKDADPEISEFVEAGQVLVGVHRATAAQAISSSTGTRSLWLELSAQLARTR